MMITVRVSPMAIFLVVYLVHGAHTKSRSSFLPIRVTRTLDLAIQWVVLRNEAPLDFGALNFVGVH